MKRIATTRVEIAPEMHELQGYGSESDNIRLAFIKLKATQISNAWRCNDGQWVLPSTIKIPSNMVCTFLRQGKGSHEIWNSPITQKPSLLLTLLPTATQQMAF